MKEAGYIEELKNFKFLYNRIIRLNNAQKFKGNRINWHQLMYRCYERLTPNERIVLRERYGLKYRGTPLNYEEVAERLGLTLNEVKVQELKALKKLGSPEFLIKLSTDNFYRKQLYQLPLSSGAMAACVVLGCRTGLAFAKLQVERIKTMCYTREDVKEELIRLHEKYAF